MGTSGRGQVGEKRRPTAAQGLKSRTTRLGWEAGPPVQLIPGAQHKVRNGSGCRPRAPSSVRSRPRNASGVIRKAASQNWAVRAEARRGQLTCPGSSEVITGHPAWSHARLPRSQAVLAGAGTCPPPGLPRRRGGSEQHLRSSKVYTFLLKMSQEVHSNARSHFQASVCLILIKAKDDRLQEKE